MRITFGVLMFTLAVTSIMAKQESPFACDRFALSPADRKRHFDELGPALRSLKTAVRELPDGYAFQFPADPKTAQLVAEWAVGERACVLSVLRR